VGSGTAHDLIAALELAGDTLLLSRSKVVA